MRLIILSEDFVVLLDGKVKHGKFFPFEAGNGIASSFIEYGQRFFDEPFYVYRSIAESIQEAHAGGLNLVELCHPLSMSKTPWANISEDYTSIDISDDQTYLEQEMHKLWQKSQFKTNQPCMVVGSSSLETVKIAQRYRQFSEHYGQMPNTAIINSHPATLALMEDKAIFFSLFAGKTLLATELVDIRDINQAKIERVVGQATDGKVVIKPSNSDGGRGVIVCKVEDIEKVVSILQACQNKQLDEPGLVARLNTEFNFQLTDLEDCKSFAYWLEADRPYFLIQAYQACENTSEYDRTLRVIFSINVTDAGAVEIILREAFAKLAPTAIQSDNPDLSKHHVSTSGASEKEDADCEPVMQLSELEKQQLQQMLSDSMPTITRQMLRCTSYEALEQMAMETADCDVIAYVKNYAHAYFFSNTFKPNDMSYADTTQLVTKFFNYQFESLQYPLVARIIAELISKNKMSLNFMRALDNIVLRLLAQKEYFLLQKIIANQKDLQSIANFHFLPEEKLHVLMNQVFIEKTIYAFSLKLLAKFLPLYTNRPQELLNQFDLLNPQIIGSASLILDNMSPIASSKIVSANRNTFFSQLSKPSAFGEDDPARYWDRDFDDSSYFDDNGYTKPEVKKLCLKNYFLRFLEDRNEAFSVVDKFKKPYSAEQIAIFEKDSDTRAIYRR